MDGLSVLLLDGAYSGMVGRRAFTAPDAYLCCLKRCKRTRYAVSVCLIAYYLSPTCNGIITFGDGKKLPGIKTPEHADVLNDIRAAILSSPISLLLLHYYKARDAAAGDMLAACCAATGARFETDL